MDKDLLKELEIPEETISDKEKLKKELKIKLSEFDEKFDVLPDGNPKKDEIKKMQERIKTLINELDKVETETLPKVIVGGGTGDDNLPRVSSGKPSAKKKADKENDFSVSSILEKVKNAIPKKDENEEELKKQVKQIKRELEVKKKTVKKEDKPVTPDPAPAPDAKPEKADSEITKKFNDAMLSYSKGEYHKAADAFKEVIIHYNKTKENKAEAGESSYMLSKLYADSRAKMLDDKQSKFYLQESALTHGYPPGMLDYGIELAQNLISGPDIDDTCLDLFEKVVSSKANDKIKNEAKRRYVETVENFKGFSSFKIWRAIQFCNDLAKEENDPFLQKNWQGRGEELAHKTNNKKGSKKGVDIFRNILAAIILAALIFIGPIGYAGKLWNYWYEDNAFWKAMKILPEPFTANGLSIEPKKEKYVSYTPFWKNLTVLLSEAPTKIELPYAHLDTVEYEGRLKTQGTVETVPADDLSFRSGNVSELTIGEGTLRAEVSTKELTSITLPESLKELTLSSCSEIEKIEIPDNVYSFVAANCYNITSVKGKTNATYKIRNLNADDTKKIVVPSAFYSVDIETSELGITMKEGVSEAAINVNELSSLVLPFSLKKLALTNSNLTGIGLSDGLEEITLSMGNLTGIDFGNSSVKRITLISCYSLTHLIVPESVTEIQVSGCSNLEALVINNPSTRISVSNCYNFQAINLPEDYNGSLSVSDCPNYVQ